MTTSTISFTIVHGGQLIAMTNKLKLKRTPEEEARHRLKKEKKQAKRKREEEGGYYRASGAASSSSKRAHVGIDVEEPREPGRKWASSDEDEDGEQYGPQPAPAPGSSRSHRRHDTHAHAQRDMQAEIEDRLFREKLFANLEDDERLDAVEARLNDFAHVPGRWRGPSEREKRKFWEEEGDEFMRLDPGEMDDEEYAEWVRVGMWRKTHKDEYAEQRRLKALHAARKAEEKARRAETKRLEREAEEERRRRRAEREGRRMEGAREVYRVRWARLFEVTEGGGEGGEEAEWRFDDVPWPVAAAQRERPSKQKGKGRDTDGDSGPGPGRPITIDDLTESAISSFLLPPSGSTRPRSTGTEAGADSTNSRSPNPHPEGVAGRSAEGETEEAVKERQRKERKDRLREAFLRFHPDKFEGRFMRRFREEERERVREAIGQVSRVLNGLLAQSGGG